MNRVALGLLSVVLCCFAFAQSAQADLIFLVNPTTDEGYFEGSLTITPGTVGSLRWDWSPGEDISLDTEYVSNVVSSGAITLSSGTVEFGIEFGEFRSPFDAITLQLELDETSPVTLTGVPSVQLPLSFGNDANRTVFYDLAATSPAASVVFGSDANMDLVLKLVPEPSTALMGLSGLLLVCGVGYRRRQRSV